MMARRIAFILMSTLVLGEQVSLALTEFDPGDVSAVTQPAVDTMIETVGIGGNHRPLLPASALGSVIGLDLGVEAIAFSVPQRFEDALKLAGVNKNIPALIPLPKLVATKGLPFGIDLGASYIGYQKNKIFGSHLQWSFLQGGTAGIDLATRASFNSVKLFFMKTTTYKWDLLISKSVLGLIEPYAGFGYEWGSGSLSVPVGGSVGLPLTVSGKSNFGATHAFGGLPINLGFLILAGEIDYSFRKMVTYGAKFAFRF